MEFVIAGKPITKKNSQQILGMGRKCPICGRPEKVFIGPSKQYKAYEKDALRQLKAQAHLIEPIDYQVTVRCLYYMPTAHLCDQNNLIEATDDILVRAGIIADDNYSIVRDHDGSRVKIDRNAPRVEIRIEKV